MIQTVPTRGYRFVAPVSSSGRLTAITIPESGGQPGPPLRMRTRVSRWLLVLVGICGIATAAFLWVMRPHDRDTSTAAVAGPNLARLTAKSTRHVSYIRTDFSGRTLPRLCAAHGRCVLVQPKDEADSIWSLDPIRGRGIELARIHSTGTENVLPDGEAFAYVEQQDKGPLNVVRVISFTGKPPQDIVVQQATSLMNLDWLPSDSGFLTTDHGNLLIVWRSGVSRVLCGAS